MTGTETTIIRMDGDNRPVTVNVLTGIVDRPNSYYTTPLKGDAAWRLFIDLVGLAYSAEVPELIKACNRAAARKQLATDADRREAALQYAGIVPVPVKSAKPHGRLCRCPRCLTQHVAAGCRKVGCRVCFA
jgi:hypothetical protein